MWIQNPKFTDAPKPTTPAEWAEYWSVPVDGGIATVWLRQNHRDNILTLTDYWRYPHTDGTSDTILGALVIAPNPWVLYAFFNPWRGRHWKHADHWYEVHAAIDDMTMLHTRSGALVNAGSLTVASAVVGDRIYDDPDDPPDLPPRSAYFNGL